MAVDGVPSAVDEALLDTVVQIPAGRVCTYGEVARIAGVGGPRQVGASLRRFGGGVPWWRVVRADGTPAEQLLAEQSHRLAAEGIPVIAGRVELSRYGWHG